MDAVKGRRRHDAGFAGLAELVVAMIFIGLLLPLVGMGLDNGWQLLTTITGRATASTDVGTLLATATSQLQGAQPLGFCAAAGAGQGGDPGAAVETPLGACAQTGLGPPPPGGASTWAAYVSPLPTPSPAACGTAELGPGALVTATADCVGFFSYDDEPSGTLTAPAGALSGTGPFAPAELTYLWRCGVACPSGSPPGSMWLTTYPATGGYTNAGCPDPEQTCGDPDWSTAVPVRRDVGQLAAGAGPVFAYTDATGSAVAEDPSADPPAVPDGALASVEVVSVTVQVAGAPDGTGTAAAALTGNVYQSPTDGNG